MHNSRGSRERRGTRAVPRRVRGWSVTHADRPDTGDETTADVLVIGGGPAGLWAASAAATAGARVILVDKGRCGAAGPTAKGLVSLWNIPHGPEREAAVSRGLARGGGLADPEWMDRVLGESAVRLAALLGLRPGAVAVPQRIVVDGRRYLTALRRHLTAAGVRIADRHPAIQLLVDGDAVVCGATGVELDGRHRRWTVRAGAVVLATGGCAFLSGGAGTEAATGEGLLMAAEAGGELSGMEFSTAYSLVGGDRRWEPRFTTLYDESGAPLDGDEFDVRCTALAALADGRRIYAELPGGGSVRYGPAAAAPVGTTSVDLPADSESGARPDVLGRVPLRPVLQGTVRGSGGVRVVGFDCATTVPGLFAAGDVAGREAVTGAIGSVEGPEAGWAICSGWWAGAGAARFARGRGIPDAARPVPAAAVVSRSGIDPRAVIGLVQEHTLPLRRSYWRSAGSLRDSIAELDALWPVTDLEADGGGADRVRGRQAAALLAVARWSGYSALARTETRGMHRRTDHPGVLHDWRRRLLTGGVDEVWVRPEGFGPACAGSGTAPA